MLKRIRAKVAALLTLGAVMALMAFSFPAQAAVTCPDGSTATNEPGGVKSCEDTFVQGQGEPAKSDKTVTEEQKGSFNSSHPTTTCTYPPPKGKCTTQ